MIDEYKTQKKVLKIKQRELLRIINQGTSDQIALDKIQEIRDAGHKIGQIKEYMKNSKDKKAKAEKNVGKLIQT